MQSLSRNCPVPDPIPPWWTKASGVPRPLQAELLPPSFPLFQSRAKPPQMSVVLGDFCPASGKWFFGCLPRSAFNVPHPRKAVVRRVPFYKPLAPFSVGPPLSAADLAGDVVLSRALSCLQGWGFPSASGQTDSLPDVMQLDIPSHPPSCGRLSFGRSGSRGSRGGRRGRSGGPRQPPALPASLRASSVGASVSQVHSVNPSEDNTLLVPSSDSPQEAPLLPAGLSTCMPQPAGGSMEGYLSLPGNRPC